MKIRITLFVSTAILLLGFQNCAKENFSAGSGLLYASNTGGSGSDTTGDGGAGGSGGSGSGSNSGSAGNGSGSSDNGPVECELQCGNSNSSQKISFHSDFTAGPSNSSCDRVCVSPNACLNLINSYVQTHGCSLSPGPGTSAAKQECEGGSKGGSSNSNSGGTAVFPGSNGTCNNAQFLDDNQVATILAKMLAQ